MEKNYCNIDLAITYFLLKSLHLKKKFAFRTGAIIVDKKLTLLAADSL